MITEEVEGKGFSAFRRKSLMATLNESIVEDAALTWFGELGYAITHGPHMAPGEPAAERVRLLTWCWLAVCVRPSGG